MPRLLYGPSRYSIVETTRTFLSIWLVSLIPGAASRGRISKMPWEARRMPASVPSISAANCSAAARA
jgi:hypothetical protein